MEEVADVASEHAIALIFRHAGEAAFDEIEGAGPVARGVPEVAAPDELTDAELVAHTHGRWVIHEAPEAVGLEVVAWRVHHWLDAAEALTPIEPLPPIAVPFVTFVDLRKELGEPSGCRFGPVDAEFREAIEHPGICHL